MIIREEIGADTILDPTGLWPPDLQQRMILPQNPNPLPIQMLSSPYTQSGMSSAVTDSRLQTTSSFMPGARSNYLNMMKRKQKQKQLVNLTDSNKKQKLPRDAATAEKQKNRREKMRKYMKQASQQPDGYNAMLELNGAQTLGERDRAHIDEYLGISQQGSPPKSGGGETLKNLKDEQREIEAKLKFIDGLINQQQTTAVKYIGGGILKRQMNEDFVVNLEQYQRAMGDLKKTMSSLQPPPRSVNHSQNFSNLNLKEDGQIEFTQKGPQLKQIYQHIDDASRQNQSRQVLSIIPTAEGGIKGQMDELDNLSASSPSTNNGHLYEATFGQRQSFDTNQYKESMQSSSFVMSGKLDHNGRATTPLITHGRGVTPLQSIPNIRDPRHTQTLEPTSAEKSFQGDTTMVQLDRSHQSGALKVITEIIVQGGNNGTNKNGDDDSSSSRKRTGTAPTQAPSAMSRVQLAFEPEKEIFHKNLYEQKAYRPRKQVTNPHFKTTTALMRNQYKTGPDSFDDSPMNGGSPETKTLVSTYGQLPLPKSTKIDQLKQREKKLSYPLKHRVGTQESAISIKQTDADDKRLTEMGKRVGQLKANAKLEVLDKSVLYQQDTDQSKGVLYFKNLDSLKNFLINKKRPIYSRKGDKIYASNFQSKTRQTRSQLNDGDAENEALKADVQKKREYLHSTITNLMPQIQLKSLKEKTQQKLNFQQAVDMVNNKFQTASQAGLITYKDQQWAPINSTQFNQNQLQFAGTQYPFDDMMNPDAIVDLRFMGNIPNPPQTFYNSSAPRSLMMSRQDHRSESSPGLTRSMKGTMSKRLQTFYGMQFSNLEQTLALNKGRNHKSRKLLGNFNDSSNSLGSHSSGGTNSSHGGNNNTRQIVFFKTSGAPKQDNGSYIVHYPHLRPRLNMMEEPKFGKPTVGMHQQFLKPQDSIPRQANIRSHIENRSSSSVGRNGYEQTIRAMSQGIERNKIKDPVAPLPQDVIIEEGSFKIASQQMDEEVELMMTQSVSQTSAVQQKPASRKHVIFSTYEGQVMPGSMSQISGNTGKQSIIKGEAKLSLPNPPKKIPPLHPLGLPPNQHKQQSKGEKETTQTKNVLGGKSSFKELLLSSPHVPLTPAAGSGTGQQYFQTNENLAGIRSQLVSGGGSRNISAEQRLSRDHGGSLKGLIQYDPSVNQNDIKRVSKMDLNIAQSKISVQR